ncbi:hypothetical protein PMAYCL1PPCAC_10093, partial [Pristionchus mayeri]
VISLFQSEKGFNSENDQEFLDAIRNGFLKTHHTMWKKTDSWTRTSSGYRRQLAPPLAAPSFGATKYSLGTSATRQLYKHRFQNPTRYID